MSAGRGGGRRLREEGNRDGEEETQKESVGRERGSSADRKDRAGRDEEGAGHTRVSTTNTTKGHQ